MLIFIGYLSINTYKNLKKMLFIKTYVKKLYSFFNMPTYIIFSIVINFFLTDVTRNRSVLEDILNKKT